MSDRDWTGLVDGLWACVVAGLGSGIPSTAWALATGGDPMEATWAAGRMLRPGWEPGAPLFAAAAVVHGTMCVVWTAVLTRFLPGGRELPAGIAAGLGIAVLDLGIAQGFFPSVAALATGPQVADHLAFGGLVGVVLGWRRGRRE